MLKLWGILLILTVSSLWGWDKSLACRRYTGFLQELLLGLEILETEVQFRQSSLKEAFARTADILQDKSPGLLFREAAVYLTKQPDALPEEGLQQGIAAVSFLIPRGEPLVSYLESFALALGKGDLKAQEQVFSLLRQQIGQCLEGALKKQDSEEKLWRYLGICGGAVFVILLI